MKAYLIALACLCAITTAAPGGGSYGQSSATGRGQTTESTCAPTTIYSTSTSWSEECVTATKTEESTYTSWYSETKTITTEYPTTIETISYKTISTHVPVTYTTKVEVTITTWSESVGTSWSESKTVVPYPESNVSEVKTVIETCISTSEICTTEIAVPYTTTKSVPVTKVTSEVKTTCTNGGGGWGSY